VEECCGQGRAETWCHWTSPIIKGRGGGGEEDVNYGDVICITMILSETLCLATVSFHWIYSNFHQDEMSRNMV